MAWGLSQLEALADPEAVRKRQQQQQQPTQGQTRAPTWNPTDIVTQNPVAKAVGGAIQGEANAAHPYDFDTMGVQKFKGQPDPWSPGGLLDNKTHQDALAQQHGQVAGPVTGGSRVLAEGSTESTLAGAPVNRPVAPAGAVTGTGGGVTGAPTGGVVNPSSLVNPPPRTDAAPGPTGPSAPTSPPQAFAPWQQAGHQLSEALSQFIQMHMNPNLAM